MDSYVYQIIQHISLGFFFLLPILGYAEIHYRIPFLPSRLYRKEPEIIFDLPIRAQKGTPVPLFLFIKDALHFPVWLQSVRITILNSHTREEKVVELNLDLEVKESFYSETIWLDPNNFPAAGEYRINARLNYRDSRKRERQLIQDNYRGIPHPPFEIRISEEVLPKQNGWYWGDLHFHSNFTSDQVEFGAPLSAGIEAAKTIGLDFLAVTDHSYDLDDHPDDYSKNDPQLKKWSLIRDEVRQLNLDSQNFCLIPGEEVSVGNSRGKNVHCLVLDEKTFLPGDGDSGEKPLRNRPTLDLPELLRRKSADSLAIAAHPVEQPPLSQKLILRRGTWDIDDFSSTELNVLQILNSGNFESLENGLKLWQDLLLRRKKYGIVAGNDAHGNYNSFRQVKIPLLKMDYHREHLFGEARTAVRSPGLNRKDILRSIRELRCLISTGPFLNPEIHHGEQVAGIGDMVRIKDKSIIRITGISTAEYGPWQSVQMVLGNYQKKREIKKKIDIPLNNHQFAEKITLSDQPDYIRLGGFTRSGDRTYFCLTNPIWMERS